MVMCCDGVFFFKQKTAYEMRIIDWSSDVCSSDLQREDRLGRELAHVADVRQLAGRRRIEAGRVDRQQAVFLAEGVDDLGHRAADRDDADRKSTRLNSSH